MAGEHMIKDPETNEGIQALRQEATTIEVAAGSGSEESEAVGEDGIYEIFSTVDAFIAVGTAPVATNNGPVTAGLAKVCRLLSTDRVAAKKMNASDSAGTVYITQQK